MNLIKWYRVMRFFYCHKMAFISKIMQGMVFFLYNSKLPGDVKIGKGTYFVCRGISINLVPGTEIGNNCIIGLRFTTARKFPYKNLPVLGNRVWIGPNVVVAGPVRVGDNVVIAANSVVTKSIPDGCIVAGIPAKIIGYTKDLDYDMFANEKDREGWAEYMVDKRTLN